MKPPESARGSAALTDPRPGQVAARVLAVWLAGGFAANYAWEMWQMPLYVGMRNGWARCAAAAASDVVILGFLYAVMAAAAANPLWFRQAGWSRAVALGIVGFLTAAAIELRALAAGEWIYDSTMPLVSVVEVGVSPVLQMIIIPLVLTWLSKRVSRGAATAPAPD
jgi:hypothetical protein